MRRQKVTKPGKGAALVPMTKITIRAIVGRGPGAREALWLRSEAEKENEEGETAKTLVVVDDALTKQSSLSPMKMAQNCRSREV